MGAPPAAAAGGFPVPAAPPMQPPPVQPAPALAQPAAPQGAYAPPPAIAAGGYGPPPVAMGPAPAGTPGSVPPPAGDGAVAAPAAAAGVTCPQCTHVNAPTNKFCAACGYNLALATASPSGAQPAAPPVAPPVAAPTSAIVLTALRADGSESGSFNVPGPTTTIGREVDKIFANDSYLSPRHATFTMRGGRVFVKDELSLNGVYLKLSPHTPVELHSGDVFRIGQEIVRFEALQPQQPSPDGVERLGSPARGYIGRIALVTGRDTTGNAFPVPEHGLSIGRERGDILFAEDGYVSGLHCQITSEGGKAYLTDLGSSNGTFIRLFSEYELHAQDILLMGQQLFRVNF